MKRLWRIIAGIFKSIWLVLNFIRVFILNCFVLIAIMFCSTFILHLTNHSHNFPVINKGALKLDLKGILVDKMSVNSYINKIENKVLGKIDKKFNVYQNLIFDVVNLIRQAKDDSNITGIVLDLHDFQGGDQISLQYIGKTLREFRLSGKPIYAIGNNYNQAQYYLSSFANEIYLSPLGAVDLKGFATNELYYNQLLTKLKINSHVFRIGNYKSAVEPLLLDKMSDQIRTMDSHWLNQLWKSYLDTVSSNRKIKPKKLFPGASKIIEKLKKEQGDTAKYAFNNKLVDHIASIPVAEKDLINKFGLDTNTSSYFNTSIYNYKPKTNEIINQKLGNIAVIMVNGAISNNNKANSDNIVSNNIIEHIRNARLNPNIKSVVLYVNSPGGSVVASEAIRQELLALHEAKKPIVVSMGSVAASGGYWISTAADCIIANPNTITGSIGIFGAINTIERSLDSIGIHADGVSTSPLAKIFSTQKLPKEVEQIMQMSVNNGYNKFVDLVAKSRKKTFEQIDNIAQGRVWTGIDAKQNGLVDSLGDFDDAVKKAQELAKITTPKLVWYNDDSTLIDTLVKAFGSNKFFDLLNNLLNLNFGILKNEFILTDDLNDPQNRYAFCLDCNNLQK
ncbi:signal peptide peptidase SppA [Candidatus Pantoea edessiphila]|uniref:Signal peptide peptidase SppA n=1 Tax=Candidatus Pantoea edessiphila TaxID=2044610 RepID=A0A2P5T2M9_9GAMM|nr:signal peptide peptidase SppA [Candidatus Pantoea edessiphila]PPI88837.1 signal peptide peptidase SppA [Candidatus Pantoea edessiphila]